MPPKREVNCIKCGKKFSTTDYDIVRFSTGTPAVKAKCPTCGGERFGIISKASFSAAELAKLPMHKSKTPKKSKSGGRSRSRTRTGHRTRR